MGLRLELCAGQSSSSTLISTNLFCVLHFVHNGIVMLNQERAFPKLLHKVGSTESSRMSKYAVALRFPFIGPKGLSPNHEKQPQTIITPPPIFTVGTMDSCRLLSPGSFCELVWPTTTDDTTVVGLITNDNETAYKEKVRALGVWCLENIQLQQNKGDDCAPPYLQLKSDVYIHLSQIHLNTS